MVRIAFSCVSVNGQNCLLLLCVCKWSELPSSTGVSVLSKSNVYNYGVCSSRVIVFIYGFVLFCLSLILNFVCLQSVKNEYSYCSRRAVCLL